MFTFNLKQKSYIIIFQLCSVYRNKERINFFTTLKINPLTPKITDFLTHFRPLLPKRKKEYIMTKPCIHNVFGSLLSIYEVKITLSSTGKPIWRILFKKVPKIWNFFFYSFFFQMDKAYLSISNYGQRWTK